MKNPNGPSLEEKEQWADYYDDLNEQWRNEECFMCGLARKIVVHSDAALEEYHPFVSGPK